MFTQVLSDTQYSIQSRNSLIVFKGKGTRFHLKKPQDMHVKWMDGWMNQAYSRLSTTHGHTTDCKLACMCWTRLVLVRPAASLYSASPLKHHPTGKQWCPNPDRMWSGQNIYQIDATGSARKTMPFMCWTITPCMSPRKSERLFWQEAIS